MRDFAGACGAERPTTLRSTKLRKHIATLSQVMNLRDNELDVLAKFLGHDIAVHREYYRLTDETIKVANVAKLLINMEKGRQGLLLDQTLDSLEYNEADDELIGGMFYFVEPALARCDKGVQFSVRPFVCQSVRPSFRLQFTSTLAF